MRAEVGGILLKETKGTCSCGWGDCRSDRYQELSREYTPLRMLEVPLLEVIEHIQMASHYSMKRKYHSPSSMYARGYHHEPAEYITALAEKVETAKRRASICLDCVRNSGGVESCRFKHE